MLKLETMTPRLALLACSLLSGCAQALVQVDRVPAGEPKGYVEFHRDYETYIWDSRSMQEFQLAFSQIVDGEEILIHDQGTHGKQRVRYACAPGIHTFFARPLLTEEGPAGARFWGEAIIMEGVVVKESHITPIKMYFHDPDLRWLDETGLHFKIRPEVEEPYSVLVTEKD